MARTKESRVEQIERLLVKLDKLNELVATREELLTKGRSEREDVIDEVESRAAHRQVPDEVKARVAQAIAPFVESDNASGDQLSGNGHVESASPSTFVSIG